MSQSGADVTGSLPLRRAPLTLTFNYDDSPDSNEKDDAEMDGDLISLVNRLQETFANLGESFRTHTTRPKIERNGQEEN